MRKADRFVQSRRWPLAGLALLLAALATLAVAAAPRAPAERVVAIGDVHGDYAALTSILETAGLIDSAHRWTGGRAVLVQTGDFLDRGPADRAVLDLLISLERQAPRAGGKVIVLLGNHEVMNIMGDLRYVSEMTFASFADKDSEKRRRAAWRDYQKFHQRRGAVETAEESAPAALSEEQWMAAHPPGYIEHREAFSPKGAYGRWLRKRDALAQVDDTVFLHGGISPPLAGKSAKEINQQIRAELSRFDRLWSFLTTRGIVLPHFDLEEAKRGAQAELERLRAVAARESAAAAARGRVWAPDDAHAYEQRSLEEFLALGSWYSVHPQGPLWYRGFAEYAEAAGAEKIAAALAGFSAQRFVVGHTPQRDGRIQARFDGRVFLIDTGMLHSYYGGRASALEIAGGRVTAVYQDQRVVLHPDPAARSAAEEAADLPGGGVEFRRASQERQAPAAPARPPRVWLDPDGNPLPFRNDEEVLEFLRTAEVVRSEDIPVGITRPRKLLLEKDGLRMHAIFRHLDERKDRVTLRDGTTEFFFRDSFLFECAAYELARMLGLDNVPPAVVRRVFGRRGSVQVWIENAMNERQRLERRMSPPDQTLWSRQRMRMHLFDALIYNTDRHAGNVLIDSSWNIWMVDHTRAFRRYETPRNPEQLTQVERGLWEGLKNLDEEECRRRLRRFLAPPELDALLKRRAALVALIEDRIREQGEDAVLYSLD